MAPFPTKHDRARLSRIFVVYLAGTESHSCLMATSGTAMRATYKVRTVISTSCPSEPRRKGPNSGLEGGQRYARLGKGGDARQHRFHGEANIPCRVSTGSKAFFCTMNLFTQK